MARPKLHDASQPFAIRTVLRLYEFLASLKLAVVMIFSVAVVLALATFIESNLGTAAVRYYVYHTRWFAGLLAMLAINIFCAASIRYPWKRHQTGFVVTHVGLLTLLAGSAISFRGSVNSQLIVFLNETSRVAIDNDRGFLVFRDIPGRPDPLKVDFTPGPFNWADLAPYAVTRRVKSWVGLDDASTSWTHPPQLLYEDKDTKIEVVDFYARSEVRQVPFLDLVFQQPSLRQEISAPLEFNSELRYDEQDIGGVGLGKAMFWQTSDGDRWKAFQECVPSRTVQDDGTVVFWSNGETFEASVRELQLLKGSGKPFPLDDGRTIELVAFAPAVDFEKLVGGGGLVSRGKQPTLPAVELQLKETVDGAISTHRIFRFAPLPWMPPNRDEPKRFAAEFYHPAVVGRVDILQGPDNRLAYRAWQKALGRVVAKGELKVDQTVAAWSTGGEAGGRAMPISGSWMMTLKRYVPQNDGKDFVRVLPLPFQKDDRGDSKRVKVRVSWRDAQSKSRRQEEFWLAQNLPEPWIDPKHRQVHNTRVGADSVMQSEYRVLETDVGFAVKLVDFDFDVDPGTNTAANYTSHIVRIDVRDDPEIKALREKLESQSDRASRQKAREELFGKIQTLIDQRVEKLKGVPLTKLDPIVAPDDALETYVITMNEPLDYPDLNGRHLRLFQENYLAPDKSRPNSQLGSIFRVNYDPGRTVKYLGSLLITTGIFTMFYMRAYFFKSVGRRPERKEQPITGAARQAATV